MNWRIGSLCSGYGALDISVQAVLGGDVVWHAEIDPAASAVLARHHPGVPNHGDIEVMDWSRAQPVDVLTAGWPCQPWSAAGKRLGREDARAIWPAVARAVRDLRPHLVALENVPRVITAGELERAVGDLAACGYDATWCCLRASDVGAPHRRERLFVVAAPDPDEIGCRRRDTRCPGSWLARWPGLRAGSAGRGTAAADTDGIEGGPPCPTLAGHGEGQDGRRPAEPGRRGSTAPDADGTGRVGARLSGPDLRGADRPAAGRDDLQHDWGRYAPAIGRWGRILGRPAPAPTVVGQRGARQLSHWLVEWLMGLNEGYVCDTPGLSRNDCLRLLGNGVLPAQGAEALGRLLIWINEGRAA